MLLQVTAFTVAHSITLGLSIYGVVSLPSRIVEPLIALSIAYVAIENLVTRELKPWRLALVFLFGLLHGLGFAGVLRELGLPRERVPDGAAVVQSRRGGRPAHGDRAARCARWSVVRSGTSALVSRTRVVVPASVAIAAIGVVLDGRASAVCSARLG